MFLLFPTCSINAYSGLAGDGTAYFGAKNTRTSKFPFLALMPNKT
jgi:hypothetical protein